MNKHFQALQKPFTTEHTEITELLFVFSVYSVVSVVRQVSIQCYKK